MSHAERHSQPVILSDWRYLTSEEVWQAEMDSGLDGFCTNAMLVNGKGSVQCLPQMVLNKVTTMPMKTLLKNRTVTDIG